jgi:hypothetical protein
LTPFWANVSIVSQLHNIKNVIMENIQHCGYAHILLTILHAKCDVTFPDWYFFTRFCKKLG